MLYLLSAGMLSDAAWSPSFSGISARNSPVVFANTESNEKHKQIINQSIYILVMQASLADTKPYKQKYQELSVPNYMYFGNVNFCKWI